jgi:Peptidase family M28
MSVSSGEGMFRLVDRYSSMGNHRTGSVVDAETARWIADELSALGLTVEIESVPFEGWDCTASVIVGGRDVQHLAMPYEWTGSVDTDRVLVEELDAGFGGDASVIDGAIARAVDGGFHAAVLATRHPAGLLRGINRTLDRERGGVPVFLVAGREFEALQREDVRVIASAACRPASTTNLVGTNPAAMNRRGLMLTTPLTGWFGCAGERGTGLAVLLNLVERLVERRQLMVVLTGGHELGWFGAHRWVDAHTDESRRIDGIVHLGASLAAEEDGPNGRELSRSRLALSSLDEAALAPIIDPLGRIGLRVRPSSSLWIGEGEAWARLARPLLSITGAGAAFHTPEDVAESSTSAASLARVAEAVAAATAAFDTVTRAFDQ